MSLFCPKKRKKEKGERKEISPTIFEKQFAGNYCEKRSLCVCVCVCVCESQRAKGREEKRDEGTCIINQSTLLATFPPSFPASFHRAASGISSGIFYVIRIERNLTSRDSERRNLTPSSDTNWIEARKKRNRLAIKSGRGHAPVSGIFPETFDGVKSDRSAGTQSYSDLHRWKPVEVQRDGFRSRPSTRRPTFKGSSVPRYYSWNTCSPIAKRRGNTTARPRALSIYD